LMMMTTWSTSGPNDDTILAFAFIFPFLSSHRVRQDRHTRAKRRFLTGISFFDMKNERNYMP
jgi:hypothetical protein